MATEAPLHTLPLTTLRGVGARFAETLEKLGLHTLQDMLFHLPFRYVDRTRVRSIASLRMHDFALTQVSVVSANIVFGRRRSLSVQVEDETGRMSLRFFHFNAAQKNAFEAGRIVRIFGEVRPGPAGLEIYHPEYDFVDDDAAQAPPEQTLTPIYNLTDGVSQQRLRSLMEQTLTFLKTDSLHELLPPNVNTHFGVSSLSEAIRFIHFPPAEANQQQLLEGEHPYQQRLAFEELLAHFLVKQQSRLSRHSDKAASIQPDTKMLERFLAQLAFSPTGAQLRSVNEVQNDMQHRYPMLRMVQGDVGSGKTLVAAMAAINTVAAGYQVAIVAPTEILAEQHAHNFRSWCEPLGMRIDWLVGKLSAKKKKAVYERLAKHESDIVIGTHALFQDELKIAKLALVVIDEQHRFGVHQRLSMRNKNSDEYTVPHQLMMTATPIPRTLAMTSYADLDFSIIDELPPGRTPVNTVVINQQRRQSVIERVAETCKAGRQCYWVCPLIEESETLSVANAEQTFVDLQEQLNDIPIALLHGRQKPAEKEAIMGAFKRGETQLLVATTVIEVGVDVPNASVMVIENPERLGLAQLHQLRGRVGRGSTESHCLLLYGDKLSAQGKERLATIRATTDGFEIAEKDLAMRGPGEFLGTRQAGEHMYRIAHHERDVHLFEEVRRVGTNLIHNDTATTHALIERWLSNAQKYTLA